MTNIDNFKSFVKKNPLLVTYVKNKTKSWQDFYELYDLYGEDENVWKEYLVVNKSEEKEDASKNKKGSSLSNIMKMAENIDTNKLQDSITSIQKAIGLFGDMLIKDDKTPSKGYTPRPIYKKFDD